MESVFQLFHQITDDPLAYARQWKRRHAGPVIGTVCSYAPEEIVVAGGGLPLRLLASGTALQTADAHLQAYSCSLVRGVLADLITGRLDLLDGTVFPHTCDSIQRLSDIWRLKTPHRFHADVIWPVTVRRPGAEAYAVEVLKGFAARFGDHFRHPVTDGALAAAAALYNRIRSRLRQLYALQRQRPGRIAGADLMAVMRAAMVMDRAELAEALAPLLAALGEETGPVATGKRLMLAGGICHLPDVHRVIEAAGAVVVADDLCTGHRYASGRIDPAIDIWTGLARCYLERTVCPAKHAGITARADDIVAAARDAGAHGVVLLYLKFCDPHLFDHPYLKQRLEDAGLPTLMVELEEGRFSEGQLRTRLEAFIEML